MTSPARRQTARALLAAPMLLLLALPVAALALSSSPAALLAGVRHPLFWPALSLSVQTSLVSLSLILVFGTPLAWWLGQPDDAGGWLRRAASVVVELPVVLPPAVVGIALLQTFGRQGVLGGVLELFGVSVSFSTAAVVLAQVVVSAPLFVQTAAAAFAGVDRELVLVARTLGESPAGAFLRVALPLAAPGILSGAALAWARALGEFGATLLFAGNLPGTTQTIPLAIYMALESDVRAAIALSVVLAGLAGVLLWGMRAALAGGGAR